MTFARSVSCRLSLLAGALLVVTGSTRATVFVLIDGAVVTSVVYDAHGGAPIAGVARLLKHDLTALTGRPPTVTADFAAVQGSAVIIGLADSPPIAALLKANHVSAAPIAGQWETYGRAVVPAPGNPRESALLIFGSDPRGTIWGVIDLTRELGVSPWEWWADVTIRRVDHLAVDGTLRYSREPSVKYRGIFLNAGAHGLNPWAGKTYDPRQGNMGPRTYARIFELLWRLKANTIWPAMTNADTPFNAIPENARLAAAYAIVRGSSHVEMHLRTNSTEWDATKRGPYNWLTNRREMINYWTEAVREFGKYENLYTVGLRNVDDFPMQGVSTPEAMADVLHDVITAQRTILSTTLHQPASEAPQVFTPYKEVLPAYETGLIQLPPDITINWPDDDFGYIRHLPDAAERRRSGGSGVYYHDTFWGPPMSYLWLQTTHPALMWEEMSKAYRFDDRRLWILNVGSIKPGEFLTQFFLALAFDTPAFGTGASARAYLRHWVEQTFGPAHAEAIAGLLWQYYRLAFDRNPEFMGWTEVFPETAIQQTAFNPLALGDEYARRADAYRRLKEKAAALMADMPADRRDAFYELVQYQIDGAADLKLRQLDLDKAITYGLQQRESANVYAERVQAAQQRILANARFYNEQVAGGKWRHMIDPLPHDLPIFEAPRVPTWNAAGTEKCGVQVDGGAFFDGTGWWTPSLPLFHPELRETHYIDVFAQGPFAATWTATAAMPINAFAQDRLDPAKVTPAPWIKLSQSAGHFSPGDHHFEDRILVSIDWAKAPAGGSGDVIITGPKFRQPVAVHVHLAPPNQVTNVSFIEANHLVSIYAVHSDARSDGWEVLDGLGHTGADLRGRLDLPSVNAADPAAIRRAPSATYRFATTTTDDRAELRAVALPTFPITSGDGVRIAVSIDGAPPRVLDFFAPEFSEAWRQHVLTNEAIETLPNLRLAPGAHTLTAYALDPGVTLDRFEIRFTGAPRAYSPVPETRIVAAP